MSNLKKKDGKNPNYQMKKYTMQDPRPAAFDWFQDV